jgi:hypothetical protein
MSCSDAPVHVPGVDKPLVSETDDVDECSLISIPRVEHDPANLLFKAPVSVSGSDKAPDSDKVPDSGSEHDLAAAAAVAAAGAGAASVADTVDGSKPDVDQRPLERPPTISSNDDAGYDSDNYPPLQRVSLNPADGTYYVGGDS